MSGRQHARAKPAKSLRTRRAIGTSSDAASKAKTKPRSSSSRGAADQKGPSRLGRAARVASRATLLIVPARVRPEPDRKSGRRARAKEGGHPTLVRRNRIPLALAAVFSLTILATSFPASALLAQHKQLAAASSQLAGLQKENRALAEQQQQLNSNAAIDRLARQDYQLIKPGQTLFDVLPPSGKALAAAPGDPVSGDPGNQPLVDPANAPDMSPDPGLTSPTPEPSPTPTSSTAKGNAGSASSSATSSQPGFVTRVANTLEFWK